MDLSNKILKGGFIMTNKEWFKEAKFGMMIEEYLEKAYDLKTIFLIVDIRHVPTEDDVLMYNYLQHFNLPVKVIATKVDKIGKTLILRHQKQVMEKLKIKNPNDIIVISSETNYGINKVWELIEEKIPE